MKELENTGISGPAPSAGKPAAEPFDGIQIRDLIRFRINSSLKFHALDKAFGDLTGFDVPEFPEGSFHLLDIVYTRDAATVLDALAGSRHRPGYFSAKFRIVTKTEELKWIWMRGPVLDASEEKAYLIEGVISDITHEKNLEKQVESEREFFRSFADALDDGLVIVSSDYRIQFMNKSLINTLGDHVGEICYKALFDCDNCCIMPECDGVQHYETCGFREYQCLSDLKTFHIRSLPIATNSGFRGRIGQFRDISRIKRLEQRFRNFAVRARAISKASNIADMGIFILVDDEQCEARLRFVNQVFCRITGYTDEELLGMSIKEMIHPDDLETAMGRYRRRLQGEPMGDRYELKLIRKDRTAVEVFFMGALSRHYGKTSTVGFVRDITLRKELQESLFLSQRLASIGRLSAEIAHEMNNPLQSVLTFNKLIEKIIQHRPFPIERLPELHEYIRYVNSEAGRCADIARNLLNFSRTTEVHMKEHEIHVVLEKTLDILRHSSEMNNVRIRTCYSPEVPLINCDFSRIQQAFMNILWNAIEAMPEGGVLTVSTTFKPQPQCSYFCKAGKYMVEIKVSDTGVGIPRENLDQIFEPFFSTKKEKSGVGLGLSVAYGIIRKHNGTIQVHSEPGVGTTFLIQLPTDVCPTCSFSQC
jgi:PAS domain S-box-containing protein